MLLPSLQDTWIWAPPRVSEEVCMALTGKVPLRREHPWTKDAIVVAVLVVYRCVSALCSRGFELTPWKSSSLKGRMVLCPRSLPMKDTAGTLLHVNFEGCKVRTAGNFWTSDVLETMCTREKLRLVERGIPELQTFKNVYTQGQLKE